MHIKVNACIAHRHLNFPNEIDFFFLKVGLIFLFIT
jgi:hypothetical protein